MGKSETETWSDEQEASKHPHTQDTLTSVSQLFSKYEDTYPKSDSEEKVQTTQKRQHKDSPKKDSSELLSSEEEPPTDKVLHDEARQKAWQLGTCFNAWCHDKITNNVASWAMRDTMNCDLPEHSKIQPNHPDPMGLPQGYMAKCKVFDCI